MSLNQVTRKFGQWWERVKSIGFFHWLFPEMEFCSCPGFYYGKLNAKKECYHLESVKLAQSENKIEIIKFSDDEYGDFLSSLISDL